MTPYLCQRSQQLQPPYLFVHSGTGPPLTKQAALVQTTLACRERTPPLQFFFCRSFVLPLLSEFLEEFV